MKVFGAGRLERIGVWRQRISGMKRGRQARVFIVVAGPGASICPQAGQRALGWGRLAKAEGDRGGEGL